MNWTTEAPTEPGMYLWRRKGSRGLPYLVALDETNNDGQMRVERETDFGGPDLFATARSLRGEWFWPVPQ